MAEGLVIDTAKTVLELLGSPLFHEIQLPQGVEAEIRKLMGTVETIKAVLLDAEKQHSKKNEVVTVWIRRLKDAFYDADDLLHDFAAQLKQREIIAGNEMRKKVRIFFAKSNQIASSLKMAHQIKAVREKIEEIRNDRQFHLTEYHVEKPTESRERRQTHSYICGEMIIGRDDEKNAIIDLLLDANYVENVSVIPIVGMGGLGKTTIVRLVYNDEEVEKKFPLRMWVCVSEVFHVKIIVEKIIKSITNKKHEKIEMDQLQEELHENINGKKYLLVLDDIWNDNHHKWRELKELLMNGARGSKILVTTRSQRVANITNKRLSYVLQGLDDDKSWSLFKQIVFEHGIAPKDSRLVEIGKETVAKCAGVPLALRTIGYLLYDKYRESDWLYFRDNELSKIPQKEDDILPILHLSYDHLPTHLKHCFAYCALFPKDYEIEKLKLINIWNAQGFLQLDDNRFLEDVGNSYFEDLLLGSFFQDPKYDEWGNVITCKMHNLMHDLAQLVAGIECSVATLDTESIDERCRHLSLNYGYTMDGSWKFINPLFREKHIRTLLFLGKSHVDLNLDDWKILSSCRHLRSLDFGKLSFKKLPSAISKLKYLRYLNVSDNISFEKLPNFILSLRNLETLDLTGCANLKELPTNIRKMVNLKALIIKGCDSLIGMPYGLGLLTNLQTLPLFVVQRRYKENRKKYAALEELNGLKNLGGKLKIKILGHLENGRLASLERKKFLEFLELEWEETETDSSDVGEVGRIHEVVLKSLNPHQNLKGISINSFTSLEISSWLSSLRNLMSIKIENCKRCQHIPPLDQLPFLNSLCLSSLCELEYISDKTNNCCSMPSTTFFPSLEKLSVYKCLKLKGWWKRDDDDGARRQMTDLPSFPCLSELDIYQCPKLTSMPLYPSLENLSLCLTSSKPLQETMMLKISTVGPSTSSSSSNSLSKLKSLDIFYIDDLESIPQEWLVNLSSLVNMRIFHCPRLSKMSQGMRCLSSLQEMKIWACGELNLGDDEDMEWQGLKRLNCLQFYRLPKLEFLPKGLQYVTTLQHLEINDCPNLMALPEWISNSTSLLRLHFTNCPKLSEGYGNNKAKDWLKISHIPNISIDWEWIQEGGRYRLNSEICSSS